MKKWMLLTNLFFSLAHGAEERTIGRSPIGALMGDAYTAIADDGSTLFYNPAILGRHRGLSFYPIPLTITGTNILNEPDRFKDMPNTPEGFSEVAMDYPIHIGANGSPTLKMGHFALTGFVDYQTNLLLMNDITPTLNIDHRYDRGFIMGIGIPVKGHYKEGSGGEQLSAGFSVKYLKREGINSSFKLTSTTLINALEADDVDTLLDNLGQIQGSGWGFDFGLDWIKGSGVNTFSAGLALMDPYTMLHTDSNPDDLEVQTQPMRLNLGTAWKMNLIDLFNLTVSADIREINKQMALMDRMRFGINLGFPMIDLYTGYNAGYYSYGLSVDLFVFQLSAGFYDKSIGQSFMQQKSSRFLIYLSLFDFTFDP